MSNICLIHQLHSKDFKKGYQFICEAESNAHLHIFVYVALLSLVIYGMILHDFVTKMA